MKVQETQIQDLKELTKEQVNEINGGDWWDTLSGPFQRVGAFISGMMDEAAGAPNEYKK